MKARIAVPQSGAWFEGHFPGRPILPGVAQLWLVLEALAHERGQPVTLREVAFARLRQLVLPGDSLELNARERDGGRVRFELTRDGVAVSNGELILGRLQQPADALRSVALATDPVPSAPPVDALLPHQPPMRFVTSIAGETATGLDCAACIPAACALVSGGNAHALACIEAAAQTAATWEAVRRWREADVPAPRVGFLVALREVVFFADRVPAGRRFAASVRLEDAAPPLTYYRFEAAIDGAPLARGTIATFLGA